jgi:hypothetical protein
LEIAGIRFVDKEKIWCLRAGGEIRTGSRNAVLQVGTGDGFGVEWLDVENDRNDVQL